MKKTCWSTVCKAIGLAALDVASACLLFDWWRIQLWPNRIPLYAITLLSLLMLHVLAFFPIRWKKSMHMRSLLSLWMVAFVHYVLQVAAIGLLGQRGNGHWHLVSALVMMALYIVVSLNLYMAGRAVVLEGEMGPEGVTFHHIQVIMFNMDSVISSSETVLEPREYGALHQGYFSIREKIEFTTPFGRSFIPAVVEMEQTISERLERINQEIQQLCRQEERKPALEKIESEMQAVLGLLRNREQLIARETGPGSIY